MVEKKKPIIARVIAATVALALIGLIAFVANSFTGNPISAYFAGRQMTEYVRQTYPDMNLTLSKATYSFKMNDYSLRASSPTSPDTTFRVMRWSSGKIVDDYQSFVLEGFNTVDRLGREMTKEITPLLKTLFGDQLRGRCFADLFGERKEFPKLPLDTPFSRDLELPATIYMDFEVQNPTLADAAAKLQKADALMKNEGFTVSAYIVELLRPDTKQGYSIQVDASLVNDGLAKALEGVLDSKDYNEKLWARSMGK